MATRGVMLWSTTAATNATADPTVNWAEGMAPSAVNNSARAEMASVALWRNDISGTLTTGGTSTAYTLTTNATFATAAEMSGALIVFIPNATCGASPTLAVDGLTARQIVTTTAVNVGAGQLIAGRVYAVTYVHATTEFRLWSSYPFDISGLTAETAVAVADVVPIYDDSGASNKKVTVPNFFKAITVLDAETSVATDDQVLISDTSDSGAANRMSVVDLFEVVNGFTEDTTPDEAGDFVLTYDTSASTVKKVKPNNFAVNENSSVGTYTSANALSGTTPIDDSIPQITEGVEVVTAAITPATTSHKVRIRFNGWCSCGTNAITSVFALHRAGAANALQVTAVTMQIQNEFHHISLEYVNSPASSSAQTYSVRVGNASANNIFFNGSSSSRFFGGASAATLVVEQINVST